jgi:hypothetical protein
MKIIHRAEPLSRLYWKLSYEYIDFDNKTYERIYASDYKIYWRILSYTENLHEDITDILEKEYQKLKRGEKLKNILDENY